MKEFIINGNDAGQRLDKFLTKAVPRLPRSLMYKSIRNKRIKLNGKRAQISDRLQSGDAVQLYLNDEFFDTNPETEFMSVPAELDILYEDENILLVNKRCGMVVHEDNEGTADTLINRIRRYLYDKGEFDPAAENSFAPALCNRLDRNTQGIVIAAKNAEALRVLNQKIKEREIGKYYLCIVLGTPPRERDTMTAYLVKNLENNTVSITDKPVPGSKTIVTTYSRLKTNGKLSLLEIRLDTGRTHQIRAHMAHIGCPLLGDGKYGINRVNSEYKIKTQALAAHKLRFGFTTDGGALEYLRGREFSIPKVWFAEKFL